MNAARLAGQERRLSELYAKQGRKQQFKDAKARDQWIGQQVAEIQKTIKEKQAKVCRSVGLPAKADAGPHRTCRRSSSSRALPVGGWSLANGSVVRHSKAGQVRGVSGRIRARQGTHASPFTDWRRRLVAVGRWLTLFPVAPLSLWWWVVVSETRHRRSKLTAGRRIWF